MADSGAKTGRIVHVNIPSTNLDESQAFYGRVFGWTFIPNTEQYVLFSDCGGIGGGFSTEQRPGQGGLSIFVQVEDIPASLQSIVEAGGSIVLEKSPIGNENPALGFYAVVRDCHGNTLGIYSDT